MVIIRSARSEDSKEIERLKSAYHSSEGLRQAPKRIERAIVGQLRYNTPGLLLVAESESEILAVALAVSQTFAELGRVMIVNDFYMMPSHRRKGIRTKLAKKLISGAEDLHTDEINLEVITGNRVAELFWKSLGFERTDRSLYKCELK